MGTMGTKMNTLRISAVLATVIGLGAAGTTAALAQANCDWYAKTALKQQQDNERMKCGFTGEAWSADLKAHAAWCQSVSPDVWKDQAKKRDQQLTTCTAKK